MARQDKAHGFFVGFSVIIGLLALIYGIYLMTIHLVDWGIFLTVIGLMIVLFLGLVFLKTEKR